MKLTSLWAIPKKMFHTFYQLPASHQQVLDDTPEPSKVEVTLLDRDNLPLARGSASLPLMLGVGVFWPDCPMPPDGQLAAAKCFRLPSGETMKVRSMTLCPGSPPHYCFWSSPP
ncbi:MAG: hypothetical protein WED15_09060 [Akkermansiaceae bacterium]